MWYHTYTKEEEIDVMEKFTERLRKAMELRGMTQAEIIEKTGINKGALSSYVSGRYEPKQNNTYLLAQALDVSVAWLLGADVPMERGEDEPVIDELDIQLREFYKSLPVEKKKALLQFLQSLRE